MVKYAGIGARVTPELILLEMRLLARVFAKSGMLLRSGAADGADKAFECGCDIENGKKEIYLPWYKFNNHSSDLNYISNESYELAKDVYVVRWNILSAASKKLMARNCYQILGKDLDDPVDVVVCWTPDGAYRAQDRTRYTGGTGQAIALADRYNIPIFNLANKDVELKNIINYVRLTQCIDIDDQLSILKIKTC